MRQLRFVLPTVQLLTAIILLQLGYRTTGPIGLDTAYASTSLFLCFGINAPAIPFKGLAFLLPEKVDRAPSTLFGLSPTDGFFLVGVVIIWFLIGRGLDRRKDLDTFPGQTSARAIAPRVFSLLLIAWGVLLLYMAVQVFQSPGRWNNYPGNVLEGVMFIAWSILLIVPSIVKLASASRAQAKTAT